MIVNLFEIESKILYEWASNMWTLHVSSSSESSLQRICILQIFQEINHHHVASNVAVSTSFYIQTRINPHYRKRSNSIYYILPNIQKNHAQFLTEYLSEPNSNLFTPLEHIDSITFGSKLQIPPETAIRLDNKSGSWQWHCIPITVKSSCRWLSESANMAASYLKQAMTLTHTTEVDQPLPGQPEDFNFYRKNAFLNNRECNRTKSLSHSSNK